MIVFGGFLHRYSEGGPPLAKRDHRNLYVFGLVPPHFPHQVSLCQ